MKKHKKQKTEIKRANNLQKKIEKHRKKVQKIKKERRKKKMKDLFSPLIPQHFDLTLFISS